MPNLFESGVEFGAERIAAIAVYCSDGRWNQHFDDFLTNGTNLSHYDRLTIPGGPGALADQPGVKATDRGALKELEFLVRAHELDRVILMQHVECAYYISILGIDPDAMEAKQSADLIAAAQNIREVTGVPRIDAYITKVAGGSVSFHRVAV